MPAPRTESGFSHTVVIPSRDRPESLRATLRSLDENAARFGRKIDVVVLNDSSPKNASKYGPVVTAKFRALKVIHVSSDSVAKMASDAGLTNLAEKRWETDYGKVRTLGLFFAVERMRKSAGNRWDPSRHLITFIDDDVRVEVPKVGGDSLVHTASLNADFIGCIEEPFADGQVGICGSSYLIDRGAHSEAVGAALGHVVGIADNLGIFTHGLPPRQAREFGQLVKFHLSKARDNHVFFPLGASYSLKGQSSLTQPGYISPDGRISISGGNMSIRAAYALSSRPFIRGPSRGDDVVYREYAVRSAWKVFDHGINLVHIHAGGGGNIVEPELGDLAGGAVLEHLGLARNEFEVLRSEFQYRAQMSQPLVPALMSALSHCAAAGQQNRVVRSALEEVGEVQRQLSSIASLTHPYNRGNLLATRPISDVPRILSDFEADQQQWRGYCQRITLKPV